MSDITIPEELAKNVAAELRHAARSAYAMENRPSTLNQWADMLDPPPPSLAAELTRITYRGDEVLALVRRHVEGLGYHQHRTAGTPCVNRDDVMRLLGGTDD